VEFVDYRDSVLRLEDFRVIFVGIGRCRQACREYEYSSSMESVDYRDSVVVGCVIFVGIGRSRQACCEYEHPSSMESVDYRDSVAVGCSCVKSLITIISCLLVNTHFKVLGLLDT